MYTHQLIKRRGGSGVDQRVHVASGHVGDEPVPPVRKEFAGDDLRLLFLDGFYQDGSEIGVGDRLVAVGVTLLLVIIWDSETVPIESDLALTLATLPAILLGLVSALHWMPGTKRLVVVDSRALSHS